MPNDNESVSHLWYQRGEFVVALPYAGAVRARMQSEFGLECTLTDSRELNLTLVRPADLDRYAVPLRRAAQARLAHGDNDRVLDILRGLKRPGESPLDDLMFCLRYDFAASCAGWVPDMGKNRYIHNVTGVPHIDGGSVLYPEPAAAPGPDAGVADSRGAGVRVGILDTGLYPHPDLAGRYLAQRDDLLSAEPHYSRFAGHATFIAGRILHRAPAADLEVRQTLRNEDATTTLWELVHDMLRFRDSGVQILNLSLGCYTTDGEPPMVLARAVQLLAPDIVIVAAAGNHGDAREDKTRPGVTPQSAFWPAALDDVVSVGADLTGPGHPPTPAPFSPLLPWVAFMSPGEAVVSTYLKGFVDIEGQRPKSFDGYARWSGTSFAAATVTGELAALTKPGGSAWAAVTELRDRAQKPDEDFPVRLFEG